jgi:RecA/RadA recombinase
MRTYTSEEWREGILMGKYNLDEIVSKNQKLYNKDPSKANKIGLGNKLRGMQDADFIIMPEWWQKGTNTKGLPFGKIVMIAGDSDSGKTSCAIAAMKAAQEQDVAVIYVETEGKTTTNDLVSWRVDSTQIMLVQSSIAEEAFELMFNLWDTFFEKYKDGKLLVVFDSLGNVVSKRDSTMDLTESNQKPGGKGQINRLGLNKLVAKRDENDVAVLIINYTYDNIGSPGKTNAGGKAVNFFSCLTYQTSRKGWLEKTVKGEKIRIGAKVQWRLFKNHLDKSNPGPKSIELDITADGISLSGVSDG